MGNDKPVKLSAKLPKTVEGNGLSTIHEQLRRFRPGIIIARVIVPEITESYGGTKQPVMVIEHIEGLPDGELSAMGEALIERARLARDKKPDTLPGIDDREPLNAEYVPGTGAGAGWND